MERINLMRRFSKLYLIFGALVLFASFVMMSVIMLAASLNGLQVHEYMVPIYTNAYGENWIEFLLVMVSVPAVVMWFKHLADDTLKQG